MAYGQFSDDNRQGNFPPSFTQFAQTNGDESEFLALSHVVVDELCKCAAEQPLATGGHILVSCYESNGSPYMLMAMMKQRGGVSLDADYVPIEITEIDLSKVYQAARININDYLSDLTVRASTIEEDHTYLCFTGHNKGNAASGYFVKALGCIKGINSSRATLKVVDAVHQFFKENKDLGGLKTKARDTVVSYLYRMLNTGDEAKLSDIVHEVASIVPGGMQESVAGLHDYLNSEKIKIPEQFRVHQQTLKKKTRIKGEDPQWSLQFEQQILGGTSDSKIYYNREKQTLTINELNVDLIKRIESELDNRGNE